MDFLQEYIILVVLGICLCVGYVIKNVIPSDKVNKYIPLIMAVLGIIINAWANQWAVTPQIVLGGLTSGLASTGMYEMFHNFIKKVGKN